MIDEIITEHRKWDMSRTKGKDTQNKVKDGRRLFSKGCKNKDSSIRT